MPDFTTRNFRWESVFVLFRNFILPVLAVVLLIGWLTNRHSSAEENNEARSIQTEQSATERNLKPETLLSPINCGDGWDNRFANAANGDVLAVAVDASGSLYIGGDFTQVGGIAANHIAKWNGLNWAALGSGTDDYVNAIAVSGNDIYAGGEFKSAGGASAKHIARWNGSSWSALGSGADANVASIAVSGGDVYAGGFFENAGNAPAKHIAKWNGSAWSALGGGTSDTVNAVVASGGNVYAGGFFETAGGIPANHVARWNGSAWSALGGGTDGDVYALAVSGNNLYVGGNFYTAGGVSNTNRIAKWDGSNWSALGSGADNTIYAIAASGSDIYTGGYFTSVSQLAANRVSRWNGSNWSALGGGTNDAAVALAASGSAVYAGGFFSTAGCRASNKIARYFLQSFSGGASGDWHNAANWNSGTIPGADSDVNIGVADTFISTADATIRDLRVDAGRTLTIAANRTLIVNGNLNLLGNVTGAGTLVVNNCSPAAISGGGEGAGYISLSLTRCVNNFGTFNFPVGTANGYSPVQISNISGSGNFTVKANQGAYPGAVDGLTADRLQRFWDLTNGGITKADVTFNYLQSDIITGTESGYRAFRIDGATATNRDGTIDTTNNRLTATNITQFSPWTLAIAPPYEADVAPRPSGNGVIQSNDTTQVQRFEIGLDQPNQSNEFQRADSAPANTRGNGVINSADTTQAQRYEIGLDARQTAGGSNAPDSPRASNEQTTAAETFNRDEQNGVVTPRRLIVESRFATAGQPVVVNIPVNAVGDESGYGFTLTYNNQTLQNPAITIGGAGGSRFCNTTTVAGQITCSVRDFPNNNSSSTTNQIGEIGAGNGQLLVTITFAVPMNATPGATPLTFTNVNASNDAAQTLEISGQSGTVTVSGPTAAQATVSGRVTNAAGRGVFGAQVVMINSNGELRYARTNPFGFYNFSEIAAGETYTINVAHKNYTFAPRTITVTEDLVGFNFTANPR